MDPILSEVKGRAARYGNSRHRIVTYVSDDERSEIDAFATGRGVPRAEAMRSLMGTGLTVAEGLSTDPGNAAAVVLNLPAEYEDKLRALSHFMHDGDIGRTASALYAQVLQEVDNKVRQALSSIDEVNRRG